MESDPNDAVTDSSPSESSPPSVADAPAWQAATSVLDEMHRWSEGLAVLHGAWRGGLLERLRQPDRVEALAATADCSTSRMAATLQVLRHFGVTEAAGEEWTLREGWRQLLDGSAPFDLDGFVDMSRVRSQQFEASLTGAEDYWRLPAADRLAVARGVSFNPASPAVQQMLRRDLSVLDGVMAALETDGHVLELGCGVGSRLTALALVFPGMRGTGLELDADLVAYGRRRADQLGVGDRVDYVVADATDYEPEHGRYDLVNWSQFFFPEPTREAALATALRACRPGAWITAPVIWDGSEPDERSREAQELALEGLLLDTWAVPPRTTDEVVAELEAAGFVQTRVDRTPFVHLVRARAPH